MERMSFKLCLIFAILYVTINISYSLPKINSAAPDFTDANVLMPDKSFGKISLSDFKGKWVLLFFYPLDFTFVCPTEIIGMSFHIHNHYQHQTQTFNNNHNHRFFRYVG